MPASITSQLIWREYFYCMSVNNPAYNRMKENPICLNIDWYDDENQFQQWKTVILFANFEKDCHINLKNKFYKMSHSHLAVCTSPDNFTLKSLHLLSERRVLLPFTNCRRPRQICWKCDTVFSTQSSEGGRFESHCGH